ncbi:MAG: polysaccharide biosynthesis C-terminal domain-containing protein [Bacteroidota bacterium]
MSLKKLAGETAIYGISSILGRLLNFVLITPFVTLPDVMTPSEYGVVSDLFFSTAFLIALLVFRLDTAVFRFASRPEYSAQAVSIRAGKLVGVGILIFLLIVFLLQHPIAQWMAYPGRTDYVWLLALVVATDAFSAIFLAKLRLDQRPWFFAGVNIVNILVNIVLVYFFLYYVPCWEAEGTILPWLPVMDSVGYFFVAVIIAAVVKLLLLVIDFIRLQSSRPAQETAKNSTFILPPSSQISSAKKKPKAASPSVGTLVTYAAPLVIVALAGIVNTLIGPTMIKSFYGETTGTNLYWSGQYGAAMKLAVFLTLFTTAYNFAAEPFFFRQAGKDPKSADLKIYASATRAFAWVCSMAIAGILLLLPLLQYYLGEDLREGLVVLPILLAANFLLGLYYNFAMAYKLTDRTLLGGGIALVGSAIVLLGNIVFLPHYGILAPAWSGFACFLVMCSLAYAVSRKYFPVPYPIGRIALYAGLTAGVVFLGWPLENIWYRIGLLILFGLGMVGLEWRWLRTVLGSD